MGKTALKTYKYNFFPNKIVVRNIRKFGWGLRDKLLEDKKLRKEMIDALVEIQHLSDIMNISTPNERKKSIATIALIKRKIDLAIKKQIENFSYELKKDYKIDVRGQTLIYREERDINSAEKIIEKKREELKEELLAKVDEDKHKETSEKLIFVEDYLKKIFKNLEDDVSSTLKILWSKANRQAINGIEIEALLDSESEEKLLRLEKINANEAIDLIKEEKALIKEIKKADTIEEFVKKVTVLVTTYLKELHTIREMLLKHRLLVYELETKIKEIKVFEEKAKMENSDIEKVEAALNKTRSQIETLYRWLYNEGKNYYQYRKAA